MSTTAKIVLVTGATSGIGRTTALHLAKQGHHVIASGRKAGELLKLKSEAAGLRLDTVVLEVTSKESIHAAVTEVDRLTNGHGLDVLINNAGFGILGPTAEITDAESALTRAQENYLNSIHDYLIGLVRLEYAMGVTPTPGSRR